MKRIQERRCVRWIGPEIGGARRREEVRWVRVRDVNARVGVVGLDSSGGAVGLVEQVKEMRLRILWLRWERVSVVDGGGGWEVVMEEVVEVEIEAAELEGAGFAVFGACRVGMPRM